MNCVTLHRVGYISEYTYDARNSERKKKFAFSTVLTEGTYLTLLFRVTKKG